MRAVQWNIISQYGKQAIGAKGKRLVAWCDSAFCDGAVKRTACRRVRRGWEIALCLRPASVWRSERATEGQGVFRKAEL